MNENGYTIEQVAQLMGVSRQYVNSLIKRARLYASNNNGKWYIHISALIDYATGRLGELEKEEKKLKKLLKSLQ